MCNLIDKLTNMCREYGKFREFYESDEDIVIDNSLNLTDIFNEFLNHDHPTIQLHLKIYKFACEYVAVLTRYEKTNYLDEKEYIKNYCIFDIWHWSHYDLKTFKRTYNANVLYQHIQQKENLHNKNKRSIYTLRSVISESKSCSFNYSVKNDKLFYDFKEQLIKEKYLENHYQTKQLNLINNKTYEYEPRVILPSKYCLKY